MQCPTLRSLQTYFTSKCEWQKIGSVDSIETQMCSIASFFVVTALQSKDEEIFEHCLGNS